MYYNNIDKILVPIAPKNWIKPDGTMFINFHQADINTQSDYGYYLVRNDNDVPPSPNAVEDKSKRQVNLDKPYADVIRTWTVLEVPSSTSNINIHNEVINDSI